MGKERASGHRGRPGVLARYLEAPSSHRPPHLAGSDAHGMTPSLRDLLDLRLHKTTSRGPRVILVESTHLMRSDPLLPRLESNHSRWWLALTILLGQVTLAFSMFATVVAFPKIMSAMSADVTSIHWVMTGFQIARTVPMPGSQEERSQSRLWPSCASICSSRPPWRPIRIPFCCCAW